MRIYSVQGPDGRIYDIQGPDGASQEQVIAALQQHLGVQPPAPEEAPAPQQKGLGAAVGKGLESLISSGRTAFGALTGSPEEAAVEAQQRQEGISRKYADQVGLDKVTEAYEKRGVLPAAGEVLRQVPYAIAEQAPQLATMFGGARAGAALGSLAGPAGTVVGGLAGAALPSLVQQFGGNIERQAQEQTERGAPISIDTGAAGAAAVPQAALDVAGSFIPFGGKLITKLTGIPTAALFGKSAAQAAKIADERLLTTLLKGTATGALAEIPTEITQQMLERAQAGLSLSDADAMREYGQTAYQVGLLAPLGAAGRFSEKSEARQQVQEQTPVAPPPEELLRIGYDQGVAAPETAQPAGEPLQIGYEQPAPAPEAPNLQRSMEQHDILAKQLEPLMAQYTAAAEQQDTEAVRTLGPQIKDLQSKITDASNLIEQLGGTTITPEELETKHQAALSNLDSKIASAHKKLIDAAQNTDFDAGEKHSQTLDTLKKQREDQIQDYTQRQQALVEKQANLTQRGQTRDLFTAAEAPVPAAPQALEAPAAPEQPAVEKAAPKSAQPELFSEYNILNTAIQNQDAPVVKRMTQAYEQQKIQERNKTRDQEKLDNNKLIQSLDERLNLEGTKVTRTEMEGEDYDRLLEQIQAEKNKIEKPQGNARTSVLDKLYKIADEHTKLTDSLEAPQTTNMQKAYAQRRIGTLAKEYERLVSTYVEPAKQKVIALHQQFRTVKPAPSADVIRAEKAAESERIMREAGAAGPSREAKRAARINAGDIKYEVENSKDFRDLAVLLGQEHPEYRAQLKEVQKRLKALRDKYGPDDKQVAEYKASSVKQLGENAKKFGRQTPEYKETLKQRIEDMRVSLASAGKQEIKSKRTTQETRKVRRAPRELGRQLFKDFEEGIASEKEGRIYRSPETKAQNEPVSTGRSLPVTDGYAAKERNMERVYNIKADRTDPIHGKTFAEAAVIARDRASSPFAKQMFGILANTLKNAKHDDMNGRVFVTNKKGRWDEGGFESITGMYFDAGNLLITPSKTVASDHEQILMHELVHAATVKGYTTDRQLAADISSLRDRVNDWLKTSEGAKYYEKNRDALRFGLPEEVKEATYGLVNNAEFLAEVFSNKAFQDMLEQIPSNIPKQSVFTRLVEAFSRFFKLKTDGLQTVLYDALVVTDRAIARTEEINKRPDAYKYVVDYGVHSAAQNIGVGKDKEGNSFFRTKREPTAFGASFIAKEVGIIDKLKGNLLGLAGRVQFVDKDAALSAALRKGVDEKVLNSLDAQNAEYFLRFGQNTSQLAGQALTNGRNQIRKGEGGGYIYESVKGPNMLDAAQALEKGKFDNDTEGEAVLTAYVTGLRADVVGWEKLNYENPAKVKEEHAQIMAMLRANPEKMAAVKEAARLYQEYNNGLIDFATQAGYFTKERAAELKHTPYIPFYRVNSNNNVELVIDKEHAIRIGNIKDEPQLHALVGDNKQILPIFTSAVQNTFMLTNMALRNKSVQESAFLLRKMGVASAMGEGMGPANASTVRFQVKGVPHFVTIDTDLYGIPADLIVKGMEGIKTSMPAIVQMMGVPATLLRNFIVRNPAYAVRQVIRDPMTAWLTTGTDATPILSSMKELAKMVAGRSETEAKLMSTGAISSNVFTGDQRDMSKFLKEISTGKTGWAKGMARLDAFALQGDAATRAVVYKDSLDKGMSEQAALLRTLESMNFNRRGLSPSVQWLNTMIPFFNAQIQGLDVLYRAFKGDMPYSEQLKIREKMVARGLLLAAGTMAYAAMMQDDEAYKRAKPEERYGNWFVYVGDSKEPLKIPVPFELGYLFKSLPEAVFNLAFGDEKAKAAVGGMLTLIDQSNPFQLPAAIKPATEVALGSSFFGGDIESAREKKILPSERYRETTTEAAKLLAQLTGNEEIRKLTGREGLSAISIDHLIRGYTGGLGIALVQLANPLLNTEVSADVAQPTKPLSKEPFIGGLFQPVQGRGTLDEAYNQMEYVQQVKGTFDDMVAKGRVAEARAFMQEHVAEMSLASVSGAVQKQLGELAKQERMIRASPKLTTEQKDVMLERLDKIKTVIARGSIAVYERTKDRTDRS